MVAFQFVHGHCGGVTLPVLWFARGERALREDERAEKKGGRNRFPVGSQCSCKCSVYLPSVCLAMNTSLCHIFIYIYINI